MVTPAVSVMSKSPHVWYWFAVIEVAAGVVARVDVAPGRPGVPGSDASSQLVVTSLNVFVVDVVIAAARVADLAEHAVVVLRAAHRHGQDVLGLGLDRARATS